MGRSIMPTRAKAFLLTAIALPVACFGVVAAAAEPPEGWRGAVDSAVLPRASEVLAQPIVAYALRAQNSRYADLKQADIDALDQKWRGEREQDAQPLISAVLSNPVSTYLTRVQAQSIGLFTEIFVMDGYGLNVGQSNISSDFWQGDEGKWQKTYAAGAKSIFVDAPEFRSDIGVWVVQVNLSIDADGKPIGAATFEVNLTELTRRQAG